MNMHEFIDYVRQQESAAQLLGIRIGAPMLPSDLLKPLVTWKQPEDELNLTCICIRSGLYAKSLTETITAHILFATGQTWIVLSSTVMGEVPDFVEYLSDNAEKFPPVIDIILHNPELRHYDCNLRSNC